MLLLLGLGLATSACMVRISDPYKDYSADGDVTGAPATCSGAPAEGTATPTGPKAPHVIGRVSTIKDDPAGTTRLVWSGTTISARWNGAGPIFAKLAVTGEHVRSDTQNDPISAPASAFYSASIDGQPATVVTVDATRSGEQLIPLGTPAASGDHEVTLVRESDARAGAHLFYGLFTDEAGKAPPAYISSTARPRRIQLIGDSPACGAGVLGPEAACAFSYDTERASDTFGALAARTLDAELTTIATPTVGVFVNADGTDTNTISAIYACADPSVAPCISAGDLTKDPAPPQVIVLMLGTSDIVRANASASDFQAAYDAFVKSVRATYPKAHVFCTLSPLLTDVNTKSLRTSVKDAIHAVVLGLGDPKIYALDFPDQGTENGLACEENPSTKTHQIMAGILTNAIREKTCW